MNEVNVIVLLKQLAIAIPSIIVGTQTITAAIHGIFNISSMIISFAKDSKLIINSR